VPAPGAGGTATFAGGVVMAPSLYVSYSESLTSSLSHLRDALSCISVHLGSRVLLNTSQSFLFWVPVPRTSQSNVVRCFDSLSGLPVVDPSYSSY
jgi:hypothetical protein